MKNFADNLKELLESKQVSQNLLADILGVKQQTISRYLNSEREPDFEKLVKIAIYFDVTTDYLLGLEH